MDYILASVIPVVSAFFGALSAFMLNLWISNKREKSKNRMHVSYSISSLSTLLNILLNYKKCVLLPRKNELEDISDKLDNSTEKINIDECSNQILHQDIKLPANLETMVLPLSAKYPNIIAIMQQLDSSLMQLNVIINEYNSYLRLYGYGHKEMQGKEFYCFVGQSKEIIKHFETQINSTLYFCLKSIELLLQYAGIYYKNFNARSVSIDDSYNDLLPPKNGSWENTNYFGNKQAKVSPILKYFQ